MGCASAKREVQSNKGCDDMPDGISLLKSEFPHNLAELVITSQHFAQIYNDKLNLYMTVNMSMHSFIVIAGTASAIFATFKDNGIPYLKWWRIALAALTAALAGLNATLHINDNVASLNTALWKMDSITAEIEVANRNIKDETDRDEKFKEYYKKIADIGHERRSTMIIVGTK